MTEFTQKKLSAPHFITLFVGVPILLVLTNNVFVPSEVWRGPYEATLGLFHPTLQANIPTLILLYVVLIHWGGMSFGQLGFRRSCLLPAAAGGLFVWLSAHMIALAVADERSLDIHADWLSIQILARTGEFLGQVFGNALTEEVLWRAFLLIQLVLVLRPRWSQGGATEQPGHVDTKQTPWSLLLLAVFLAALAFAVSHVPNRIMKERYVNADAVISDQLTLLFMGAWFCWLYVRTENLFLAVILHSLVNKSMALFAEHPVSPDAILLSSTFVGIVWPWLFHRTSTTTETT